MKTVKQIANEIMSEVNKKHEWGFKYTSNHCDTVDIVRNAIIKGIEKGIQKGFDLSIECCKFGSSKETIEALRKYADSMMKEIKEAREKV